MYYLKDIHIFIKHTIKFDALYLKKNKYIYWFAKSVFLKCLIEVSVGISRMEAGRSSNNKINWKDKARLSISQTILGCRNGVPLVL